MSIAAASKTTLYINDRKNVIYDVKKVQLIYDSFDKSAGQMFNLNVFFLFL